MTLFTIQTVQKYKETATDAPTHMWMDRNAYFTCRPKTGSWVYGYGCRRDQFGVLNKS